MKTSGWWDVKKWILSCGAEAKVMEAEELKGEIVEELKTTKSRFSKKSTSRGRGFKS